MGTVQGTGAMGLLAVDFTVVALILGFESEALIQLPLLLLTGFTLLRAERGKVQTTLLVFNVSFLLAF